MRVTKIDKIDCDIFVFMKLEFQYKKEDKKTSQQHLDQFNWRPSFRDKLIPSSGQMLKENTKKLSKKSVTKIQYSKR